MLCFIQKIWGCFWLLWAALPVFCGYRLSGTQCSWPSCWAVGFGVLLTNSKNVPQTIKQAQTVHSKGAVFFWTRLLNILQNIRARFKHRMQSGWFLVGAGMLFVPSGLMDSILFFLSLMNVTKSGKTQTSEWKDTDSDLCLVTSRWTWTWTNVLASQL